MVGARGDGGSFARLGVSKRWYGKATIVSRDDATMASLGFGCMRLPAISEDSPDRIDFDQLEEMVDCFMASGFDYFDTARTYHGGLGEGALKRALVDRYPREKFRLATKAPAYLVASKDAAERMFYTSLEDLQVDYVDCYLLHNLGGPRTAVYDEYGMWDFVEERRDEGLVESVGFSFHGTPAELETLLSKHPNVDFVQLQINFADWRDPSVQSEACYQIARKHAVPIVVMEPLKGGLLTKPVADKTADVRQQPRLVSAALRFAAGLDGVEIVLSGMSTIAQMRENLAIMKDAMPLDADEHNLLVRRAADIEQARRIPCTSCGYCVSACEIGVMIPQAVGALNIESSFGDREKARQAYLWTRGGAASACVGCGSCERSCPQRLPIRKLLREAASRYEL